MRKSFKKPISVLSATAIAATMITVPITASAAATRADFLDGTLTVTSDTAYPEAKIIAAKYNSNGSLKSVDMQDANITVGTSTFTVDAEPGDKVFLWKDMTMKDMAPITSTIEIYGDEPTATSGTDATAAPTPTQATSADGVWKFDFGTAEDAADGYTVVTTDENYMENLTAGTKTYGFIGNRADDYKLGDRMDGFATQQGQTIQLQAGGGTGLNDGIGSVGEDELGNAGDKYYPVRFALKVEEETYYKVKATVTTLDNTKDATASLYTERKHPLYTEKTIKAGETETTEFTIRVTPIYYKADGKATADEMVNVSVVGENTALASLEIEQIDTATTLWVLGDSTVTDGNCDLPFWPLQNYTGVGSGLTKYLPSDIAMVNEGEGGLDAHDNNHFNMVKNRIKAGDYMYVEYGHNHRDDGAAGYVTCLDKYWQACKAVGATLILVGPIDRTNNYDSSTNTWSTSLAQYSRCAKGYVDSMIYGGETAAAKYTSTYTASGEEAALAYRDEVVKAANGVRQVENIAFVDLNQPSLDWFGEITKSGSIKGKDVTNNSQLLDYYFRTGKGGGTDSTHPNDTGAENLAYLFFTTSDKDAYPALKPLMANFEEGKTHELPTRVDQWIMDADVPGGSQWPSYSYAKVEYPVLIKDVAVNEETNQFENMTVYVQDSIPSYALGVLEILDENGEVVSTSYTTTHLDNTNGKNYTSVMPFSTTTPVTLGENQTYRAYMWSCSDTEDRPLTEAEGGKRLSGYYTPTDIDTYMLPGEDGDVETFSYYGKTQLTDADVWKFGGSAGHDFTLGKDTSDVTYSRMYSDGAKNGSANQGSFYLMRTMNDETGTSGKYMISADFKYVSGGGVNFAWSKGYTANKSPFVTEEFKAFTIASNGVVKVDDKEIGTISPTSWTNVKYILDMDAGTATVSVAGGTPVTVDVADYQNLTGPSISTLNSFIVEGQKTAFDINVSNLTVAKLKADKTPKTQTVTVNVPDDQKSMGTVYINNEAATTATVVQGANVALKAEPADGYVFTGWKDSTGKELSAELELTVKAAKDLTLTAEFAKQNGVEAVTSFNVSADNMCVKAGSDTAIALSVSDVVDASGNPVAYEASDVTWSCDTEGAVIDGTTLSLSGLTLADDTTQEVPVKAVINNIEKTVTIIAYSYDFYENVNGGKTTASYDGPVTSVANKNAIAFPAGNSSATLTLPNPVSLDETKTISYIAAFQSKTCGQPRTFEIYDSNGTKVVNEVIGYSWNILTVGGTIEGATISGGTNFESALTQDTWGTPVEITIDKAAGTGTVTFNGASAAITINTSATDIASIKFTSKSGAPDYTARALDMTDITIK